MQIKGQDKIIGKIKCLEPQPGVLTPGQEYELYAYNEAYVRVRGDNKRIRWYPRTHFDLEGTEIGTLQGFEITDPIPERQQDEATVIITLKDGTRRWCFFATPTWLSNSLAQKHW